MRYQARFATTLSIVLALSPMSVAAQSQATSTRTNTTRNADSRPVSLVLADVPFQAALDSLSRIGDVRFTFSSSRIPESRRVSIRADSVPFDDVMRSVLKELGVSARPTRSGIFVLTPTTRRDSVVQPTREAPPLQGAVVGRVTNESGAPLQGASVTISGTPYDALTDEDGRYRISNLDPGTYSVVVQLLGYADAQKSVAVAADEEVVVDFALTVSALPLDEVVATGTAFATTVRTVPNPISVITTQDIQAKGATKLEDLLRGEIPGVMALSNGQQDYQSTYIYARGNAGGRTQDVMKIYIDGVEVARPDYLSTIDPKSIDRIEVVRGPQSATIYGSEAASGVLQIFTKKGTPGLGRPQLDLMASAGAIESDYTPTGVRTPLTQDYSLGVSGGGESFSYSGSASYSTTGEWIKHYGSKTMSFAGGLRAVQGPLTAELTARWSDRDYDSAGSPIFLRYPAGACDQCGNPNYHENTEYALSQTTIALTLGYQPTRNWQHTLTLGEDQNGSAYHQPRPSYNTPADSLVRLGNSEIRRRQVRYHTAYATELAESITARLTAGADYWNNDVRGNSASNLLSALGTIRPTASTSYTVANDGWWNAGYFAMAELGFRDQLYLTLAARLEDNPNLGEDHGHPFAPRFGAAYVRELGGASVKLRAQWGKGVRPPPRDARPGRPPTATTVTLPNAEIAPEEKSGWDAGVDLYWGTRAFFSLTRFDEKAKNLIVLETLDPFPPYLGVFQYRNIGVVALEGWEAEGRVAFGPLMLSVNYAYSDNVVKQVDAATAANPDATLQVGDRTNFAPKHSGGGRLTARLLRGSVSVDGSVMAGWRALDNVAYLDHVYGGDPYRGSYRAYYVEYPALWKWNLRANQALSDRLQVFLRVDNLANDQGADRISANVTPGRTTVLGLRWGW